MLVVISHLSEGTFPLLDQIFPGQVGVMIFFSLSGFLMAFLYIGNTISATSVWNYLISRFSRIAPAYLLIIVLSFVIYTRIDPEFPYAITYDNVLRHLLFSGRVSVFWSIPPEVQFYLIFPLIWLAAYHYRTHSNVFGLILVAMGALALFSYRDVFPGTFVGSKLHFFLFGAIAGVLRRNIDVEAQPPYAIAVVHLMLLVMIVAAVAGVLSVHLFDKDEFYTKLIAAYFSALFVFVFSIRSRLAAMVFENRLMIMLGNFSFSLYLLHVPIIYLISKAIGVPKSSPWLLLLTAVIIFLVSWINYKFIELPGARLVKYLGGRVSTLRSQYLAARSS